MINWKFLQQRDTGRVSQPLHSQLKTICIGKNIEINITGSFVNNKSGIRKLRNTIQYYDKINIGCGDNIINIVPGWLNINKLREKEIFCGTVSNKQDACFLNCDVLKELPLIENNIKYVYASNFIEHLTFQESIDFLKKCFKIMKKGGVIRLSFPDLELWCKNYTFNNKKFFKQYYKFTGGYNRLPELKTKGEIFMSQLHNWGHRWGWDIESMRHVLTITGFSKIKKKKHLKSAIVDINTIEPKTKVRVLECTYIEAFK